MATIINGSNLNLYFHLLIGTEHGLTFKLKKMDYVIKGLSVFFILVSGNFSDENEAQRDGNIRSDL